MTSDSASEFLVLVSTDEELRSRIESATDDFLFELASSEARERGYEFTRKDLQDALLSAADLQDIPLADDPDGGAGKCRSGCRTPCVYCNKIQEVVEFEEFSAG